MEVTPDGLVESRAQPFLRLTDPAPARLVPAAGSAQLRGQALRLFADGRVFGVASRAEQVLHRPVRQPLDELRLADQRLATLTEDLAGQFAQARTTLAIGWQDIHGVLERHRPEPGQPAPDLHPQVVRLGRDLVDQQQPLGGGRTGHGVLLARDVEREVYA